MSSTSIDILKLRVLLAPQGIITVTTGTGEIGRFFQKRFGTSDYKVIYQKWCDELEKIRGSKIALIGVPMDVGAGFERGSFKGPLGIRTALLEGDFYEVMSREGIVDIGDVYVNPGLIDDSYYVESLKESVRTARRKRIEKLDPEAFEVANTWDFPVAPHSVYLEALKCLRAINGDIDVVALGGDHSISRIPVTDLVEPEQAKKGVLGVLHFDAHTDLLDLRDGTPYNFATWAYHANDLIGRKKRMVQVGVRVSGKSTKEWEDELDLTQIRMDQIDPEAPDSVLCDRVVNIFKNAGVERIFISNDIDGTDPKYAASTGTKEENGLHPRTVFALIEAMGHSFNVVGGDITEVAPPLNTDIPGEPSKTLRLAAGYLVSLMSATLKHELPNPFHTVESSD